MRFHLTSGSTLDTFSVLMKSSHGGSEAGGEVDGEKVDPVKQIEFRQARTSHDLAKVLLYNLRSKLMFIQSGDLHFSNKKSIKPSQGMKLLLPRLYPPLPHIL
jgi:hypothetical protein